MENKNMKNSYLKKLIRQGFTYRRFLDNIGKNYFLKDDEIISLQNEQLSKLIVHCYENVPYYTDLFDDLGIKPDDIQTRDDLKKLPAIDKTTVKENYNKFIAKNSIKMFCTIGYTSGSSGVPGKFLRNYQSINAENAFLWRFWKQNGDFGFKRITLRGDIIVPTSRTKPPFWKYNSADNELLMSSYHLSERNIEAYLDTIEEYKPEILYAYPSTAYLLANFCKINGRTLKLKAVFTSSEMLYLYQKNLIQNTFNAKVYDWYGQAERVVAISYCTNQSYHVVEDYSIVEFMNLNGTCELVGTSLYNYAMPLLRYRTGDTIKLSPEKCACGCNFRVVEELQGRQVDYLETPEGARITIVNHIPRGIANIFETQFVQEKPGEVTIKVVTTPNFSEKDKIQLIKNTVEHTSPKMKIVVEKVEEIPRGPNGKFKTIINKSNLV
jgi:phenylacetate-CoA ligase